MNTVQLVARTSYACVVLLRLEALSSVLDDCGAAADADGALGWRPMISARVRQNNDAR